MTLSIVDYILVGMSLFASLVFALALCMILGIFTKNYKAAQTMTMPVTFLAMIPCSLPCSPTWTRCRWRQRCWCWL